MTTTAPPAPADEPQGPAYWAAKRFGRPMPNTTTPTTPTEWHQKLYPKENTR